MHVLQLYCMLWCDPCQLFHLFPCIMGGLPCSMRCAPSIVDLVAFIFIFLTCQRIIGILCKVQCSCCWGIRTFVGVGWGGTECSEVTDNCSTGGNQWLFIIEGAWISICDLQQDCLGHSSSCSLVLDVCLLSLLVVSYNSWLWSPFSQLWLLTFSSPVSGVLVKLL